MCLCCKKCIKNSFRIFLFVGIPLILIKLYFNLTFDHEYEITKDGGKFVKLDDGRYLEYFTNGDDISKDIVLYIPGLGATSWGMSEGFKKKPKLYENHYWITISLPGFGGSTLKADRNLEDFNDDIEEFLTKLGLIDREIIIFGASMGSMHTYGLACTNDSKIKIKKVILSCPLAPGNMVEGNAEEMKYEDLEKSKIVFDVMGFLYYTVPEILMKITPGMDDCLNFDKETTKMSMKDARRCGRFTKKGYFYNGVFTNKPHTVKCSPERTKELKDKVLITFGTNDSLCPQKNINFYLSEFDGKMENVMQFNEGHCHCIRHVEEIFDRALNM